MVIRLENAATGLTDAFLIGNGSLGAVVHGRPGRERVDLNLDTLWSGGPASSGRALDGGVTPEPSRISDLRRAVIDGDDETADALARGLQSSTWTQSYQPLGALRWTWDAATDRYRRELDLDVGEVTVISGSVATSFVSMPDGVFVNEIAGSASDLGFECAHPHTLTIENDAVGRQWLTAAGRAPAAVVPDYVRTIGQGVRYDDGALGADGTVCAGMGWAVVAVLDASDADARIIAAAEDGYRGAHRRPSADVGELAAQARARIEAALARATRDLRSRHRTDYTSLAARSRLELDTGDEAEDRAIEDLFALGRHLLISASRPGSSAANLQGIWNVDVRPAWSCNYTTNINLEMNYWAAEVTGLPELTEPLLELVHGLVGAGRETACERYLSAGAVAHHNTDIWYFTAPAAGEPRWSNWTGALPWLTSHIRSRRSFAGAQPDGGTDGEDARRENTALRAVAEFVLGELVPNRTGELVVAPSSSPEQLFVRGGGEFSVTAGATIDQELAAEALAAWFEVAPAGDELATRCREAVRRLRVPSVDESGALEEWSGALDASEPGHRHLSHLYGVYPGSRITRDTPTEFAAARKALDSRIAAGSGHTSWSAAWLLCLAARFGDGALAQTALDSLRRDLLSPSLLSIHPHPQWPDGAVFQFDGNSGTTAGIAELLVQSHTDRIEILPALPPRWKAGRATGLRARGGLRVDVAWDYGLPASVALHASTNQCVLLDIDERVLLEGAAPRADRARSSRMVWEVDIRAGESIEFEPLLHDAPWRE